MKKAKIRVSYLVTGLIVVIQFIILVTLFVVITNQVSQSVKENTVSSMQTMVEERSMILENYVHEVENYLIAYSKAGEIREVQLNPTDPVALKNAQQYTEKFSADIENLEGIYASEWSTHILVHTQASVAGITTRPDEEPRKQLHDSMLAADGVFNTGFLISPATGQQIISMYYACLDENGNPIGLVGEGIFTTGLKDILGELPNNDLEQAKYYLINARTGEYIFHPLPEMEGIVAEEEYIKNIIEMSNSQAESITSFLEYSDETGDNIAAYHYIADRGWLFVMTDPTDEIFTSVNRVKQILLVLSVLALVLLVCASFITISICMKPLNPIGKTLLRISGCDISNDSDVKKYMNRKDDLGGIAEASYVVIKALRKIVETLQGCCLTLNDKVDTLKQSSSNLVDCVTDNISITEELSAGIDDVNSAIENINVEIGSIHSAINVLAEELEDSTKSSDEMMAGAQEMRDTAKMTFQNSESKLESTKRLVEDAMESLNSLSQINGMASSILEIAAQTNLLSINASIEAARSGEAGRGFAVVASEIGKLAETSKSTASNIQELCTASNESIVVVNECVQSIMEFIEKDVLESLNQFSTRSENYSESVENIKNHIDSINEFVGNLQKSVRQISSNITNVQDVSDQNSAAIGVIVEKSERTADIAHEIQQQSEENQKMAESLEEIVNKFEV